MPTSTASPTPPTPSTPSSPHSQARNQPPPRHRSVQRSQVTNRAILLAFVVLAVSALVLIGILVSTTAFHSSTPNSHSHSTADSSPLADAPAARPPRDLTLRGTLRSNTLNAVVSVPHVPLLLTPSFASAPPSQTFVSVVHLFTPSPTSPTSSPTSALGSTAPTARAIPNSSGQAGQAALSCTKVADASPGPYPDLMMLCQGGAQLPHGQLTFGGPATPASPADTTTTATSTSTHAPVRLTFAIISGTGAYATTHGVVQVTRLTPTRQDWSFDFTPTHPASPATPSD